MSFKSIFIPKGHKFRLSGQAAQLSFKLSVLTSIVIMRTSIKSTLAAAIICFMANNAEAVESSDLVRASIIEKVSRFIEWPTWTNELFTICVTDKSPLLPALQTYYANTSLAGKPVSLLIFNDLKYLKDCQIIYLNDDNQSDDLPPILQLTSNQPILIVTGKKDDVNQGAHIDFFVKDTRLNLEVNRTALMNSGLKASYHLLKVARIVE